ncbi:MAG: DUF434 domain-containing protein [Planctomycetes bacterium]|nr:DUF434 domain-containing protein [Planctomycetota bacterium]
MPDRRVHRGPHPEDGRLFAAGALGPLRAAVSELSWLLGRGYPPDASLELCGNRHALEERQRRAVRRCACTDAQRGIRAARRMPPESLRGATLWIDGFNVLTSIEAALSGGVLLVGRDRVLRDMASMHGSYRMVHETGPALELLSDALASLDVAECRFLLDAPVSNSGRLRGAILEHAAGGGLPWRVELVADPDRVLVALEPDPSSVVASADAGVLDRVPRWFPLAEAAVQRSQRTPWLVDLGTDVP